MPEGIAGKGVDFVVGCQRDGVAHVCNVEFVQELVSGDIADFTL